LRTGPRAECSDGSIGERFSALIEGNSQAEGKPANTVKPLLIVLKHCSMYYGVHCWRIFTIANTYQKYSLSGDSLH